MKNRIIVPIVAALLLGVAGCDKENGNDSPKEYTITLNYDESLCVVNVPSSAAEGEKVSVEVAVIEEGYYLYSVTVNNVACEQEKPSEGTRSFYSFTMPAKNVTLSAIVLPEAAPTYLITYDAEAVDSEYYTVDCPNYGEADSQIKVTVTMTDPRRKVSELTYNGHPCDLLSVIEADSKYVFGFTMPSESVFLAFTVSLDRHLIRPVAGENSYITMLNCSDHWDDPDDERIYDESVEGLVKFWWGASLGYEADMKITSDSGNDLKMYWTDEDSDFGECWFFVMPDEGVTMQTTATEKTDYLGKPFVGDYVGYQILAGVNNVWTPSATTLSMTLNGNTSFYAQSTDENSFNFDGCYKYDLEKNTFVCLEEYSDNGYGKKDFGVNGTWFEDGYAFVYVTNLLEDKPDNMKYYFVSQKPGFTMVDASYDSYGSRHLIEVENEGVRSWTLIETMNLRATRVDLKFTVGSSISQKCEAIVYDGESALYRYTYAGEGSTPVFTVHGKEAGSYEGASLVLDGFGNAKCDGVEGTYTLNRNILCVVLSSGEKLYYLLDTDNKTCIAVKSEDWTGAENFSASGDCVYNGAEDQGKISLSFDHYLTGATKKGNVAVKVTLGSNDSRDVISSNVPYLWEPSTSKIYISGILCGTADGRSTQRVDIILNVSDDLSSMSVEGDVILRAASGGNNCYLPLNELTLTTE